MADEQSFTPGPWKVEGGGERRRLRPDGALAMIAVPKPSSAHADLQRDLEAYFRQKTPPWIPAREVDLGSRAMDKEVKRADIMAMSVTYPPRFIICEVKVSRADFLKDIKSEKYLAYTWHCNQFYFATPYGLVTGEDIPEWCGWLEQQENDRRFIERWTGEENRSFKMSEEVWHSFAKRLAG